MLENHQVTVLCIEGKRNNHFAFAADLIRKGYQVHIAESGTEGLRFLDETCPNIIVINAASLRTNGLRITNRIRNRLPECPILLIITEEERLEDTQANIVLKLPFTVQKLVNRLRAFQTIEEKHLHVLGPLQLNTRSNMVACNGKETHLTPRLTRLLCHMMDQPGITLTREDLFKQVWDTNYTGDTRTLDVHISWLRQAIEEDPRKPVLITTERSVGYKLNL
ncbi:MAG: response regulator transcription factor [Anaerolineaceae bacterium]